jgi:uncharacterized hydrophobic protein (TIGR00271 family)
MPKGIALSDLDRMREQLFFDGADSGRKLSRFWALLVLAAIIASAGIVTDSTATVIGAMIVAPLMTPILGTVLSITTSDGANLARSLALVAAGATAVVAVGYLVGLAVDYDIVSATSSQVEGRINPRFIDLVAALATGAVGAFALVRSDVSDTLPGVAIAISLVPPLAVVGITLEAGAEGEAAGALLLFLTNVAAILLSGIVVMALYRVRSAAGRADSRSMRDTASVVLVVAFVLVIAVPLAATSGRIAQVTLTAGSVSQVAEAWAQPHGWRIDRVDLHLSEMIVRAAGPLPAPDPERLRRDLDAAGLEGVDVRLVLRPEETVELTAG